MERISTGAAKLDKLLGGGFPAGYNFVIAGKNDTDKSTLVHVLISNYIKSGGKCLYILTNRDPKNLKDEFEDAGIDYKKISKKLEILDCFSWKAGDKDSVNIKGLTNLSIQLEKLREKLGKKNTMEVFDTASDFFINSRSDLVIQFLESSCARVLKSGAIAIFIVDSGAQSEKDLAALESITQGTIEIENKGEANILRVSKLIGLKHDNKWVKYKIGKGKLVFG